jgi:hypothetical protein
MSHHLDTPLAAQNGTFGFAGRNGRAMADNAPEAMLSLVAGTAVPSGLQPAVAKDQRSSTFPYVIPVG